MNSLEILKEALLLRDQVGLLLALLFEPEVLLEMVCHEVATESLAYFDVRAVLLKLGHE